jgi:uncharacterized membrane protein (DUF485 family)
MADSVRSPQTDSGVPRDGDPDALRIDWSAIESEPEFQELVRTRRSFVIPATIFFLTWYMGFIVLTAVAPDFMGERVYEGLTVGYCLALTQFLMVLVLGIWYLKKAENVFDPLAEKAIARYAEEHPGDVARGAGDGRAEAPVAERTETVR